jgi:adenine phosphoribosyltransferase
MDATSDWLKAYIRDVPDFPSPGVVYKDITPLLGNARAFAACVATLAGALAGPPVDKVLGIEARGFIVAAPVAVYLGAGFVPLRKAGKLPWNTRRKSYGLEYGSDTMEVHEDAVVPGERVLVIDDVLATGGTALSAVELVTELGAEVVGLGCIIELGFLAGRGKLGELPVVSLLKYD